MFGSFYFLNYIYIM